MKFLLWHEFQGAEQTMATTLAVPGKDLAWTQANKQTNKNFALCLMEWSRKNKEFHT